MKIEIEVRNTPKGFCVIGARTIEQGNNGRTRIRSTAWQSKRKATKYECLPNLPMILRELFQQPGRFKNRSIQ